MRACVRSIRYGAPTLSRDHLEKTALSISQCNGNRTPRSSHAWWTGPCSWFGRSKTSKHMSAQGLRCLRDVGAHVVGTVLNAVNLNRHEYSYYYHYYYYKRKDTERTSRPLPAPETSKAHRLPIDRSVRKELCPWGGATAIRNISPRTRCACGSRRKHRGVRGVGRLCPAVCQRREKASVGARGHTARPWRRLRRCTGRDRRPFGCRATGLRMIPMHSNQRSMRSPPAARGNNLAFTSLPVGTSSTMPWSFPTHAAEYIEGAGEFQSIIHGGPGVAGKDAVLRLSNCQHVTTRD